MLDADNETIDVHAMAIDGDMKAVSAAAAAGISVNEFDSEGFTPAHYAASADDSDMLRVLAEANVDLNAQSSQTGSTLASVAASRDR
jgi:ankyrin repeat protein